MRVASFSGPSGAGKTTAIAGLIRHFVSQGVTVGAIKHTHHLLNDENRGDTATFRSAGAEPVLLASRNEAVVFTGSETRRITFDQPEDLVRTFATDIVMIEGFNLPGPRIELNRDLRWTTAELIARLESSWQS